MEQTRAALTAELVRALEEILGAYDKERAMELAAYHEAQAAIVALSGGAGAGEPGRETPPPITAAQLMREASRTGHLDAMLRDGDATARRLSAAARVRATLPSLCREHPASRAAGDIAALLYESGLIGLPSEDVNGEVSREPQELDEPSPEEYEAHRTELAEYYLRANDPQVRQWRVWMDASAERRRRLLTEALELARGLAALPPA